MNFTESIDTLSSTIFGLICHQNPEILAKIGDHTLMLCPRCAGLHAGLFLFLVYTLPFFKGKISMIGWFSKAFCSVSLLLLFSEWLLAQLQITQSTNESRYITGLLAGNASCMLLMAYRNYALYAVKSSANRSILLILLMLSLFSGLGFTFLSNGHVISLLLLIMVVLNLAFILHTIAMRVFNVLSKNHKIQLS
ncbi:DUF2085 domain-containing protein [Draconibacterium sediminis]|uniref:DUF2085 domain-containing protein n=1 Tax=Draconibacterium sediminis TaxID=1544798 RepID=UPI0026EAA7EE|nr:DUF2085 domain-containing protein [Draconibacterium sediminis]